MRINVLQLLITCFIECEAADTKACVSGMWLFCVEIDSDDVD